MSAFADALIAARILQGRQDATQFTLTMRGGSFPRRHRYSVQLYLADHLATERAELVVIAHDFAG